MDSPNVDYIHPELEALLGKYRKIEDCLQGEDKVKSRKSEYIPIPEGDQEEGETAARYKTYLQRAVFYPVTRRTLAGLLGEVFRVDPVLYEDSPQLIKDIAENIDGMGNTLDMQAKAALSYVLAFSRCGLLVDFPRFDGESRPSQSQISAGVVSPSIQVYDPRSVINWRVSKVGPSHRLTMVTLKEKEIIEDDGFEHKTRDIWRVLRLYNGFYWQEVWIQAEGKENEFVMIDKFPVLDGNGKQWEEIPFTFAGATNNDAKPDDPILFDVAALNLAHFRNSADYEESVYLVGQPTPTASGLTPEWVKDYYSDGFGIGSRTFATGPQGAAFGLLQASPNTLAFEAMKHKEEQLKAIGAKLVEQSGVARTLGEAQIEEAADNSILANAAKNVSRALTKCLKQCGRFVSSNLVDGVDDVYYELNTKFSTSRMTAQEMQALVQTWQSGLISKPEARNLMREGGRELDEDDIAEEDIANEDPLAGSGNSNTNPQQEDAA